MPVGEEFPEKEMVKIVRKNLLFVGRREGKKERKGREIKEFETFMPLLDPPPHFLFSDHLAFRSRLFF
jgi:hypothetical protein